MILSILSTLELESERVSISNLTEPILLFAEKILKLDSAFLIFSYTITEHGPV